jgi:hypothetical protein
MNKKLSVIGLHFFVLMFILFQIGCGSKAYLNVDYSLPDGSQSLSGKKVFLQVADSRSDKEIFTENAKKKYKDFTGLFSLTVVTADERRQVVGAYDLSGLFKEALSKRLAAMGAVVLDTQGDSIGRGVVGRPHVDAPRVGWNRVEGVGQHVG